MRDARMADDERIGDVPLVHERVEGEGGVRLHVARAGEGPPVVLLHGFPEHWRSWRNQVGPLVAAGFSVWMPDLRGYHRSGRPAHRDAYRLDRLVGDAAAVVRAAGRATGHARAHVAGHDWGGIVAWTFAGVHPGLLDRLVILNAPHLRLYLEQVRRPAQALRSWYVLFFQLPRLPEWALAARGFKAVREMFRRTTTRPGAYPEDEVARNVAVLAEPGALKAAVDYYRANMRPAAVALGRAARTEAETLVIWGDRDPALDQRLLRGLERVAPRARVHHVRAAGHWVQHEAAEEVSRVLVAFLSGA